MKVIVFGATGSVGKLAVNKLLEEGHKVTAVARNPAKLEINHPSLIRQSADVMDLTSVKQAVHGHDAVVVALGSGMSRSSKVRSKGTLNIIQAMQANGVKRLVCQSTLGTGESWSNLNFFWKRIMFGFLLRPVFKDHVLQEHMVRASGLDWTLVRPSAFTDKPGNGDFRVGFGPEAKNLSLKIARSDVAEFLKRQITDKSWIHQAVGISN